MEGRARDQSLGDVQHLVRAADSQVVATALCQAPPQRLELEMLLLHGGHHCVMPVVV